MPPPRRPSWRSAYTRGHLRRLRRARRRRAAPRSLVLRVLLQPGLARQHGAGNLDHRHGAVLTRALKDAIRLLLRRAGAPHEDPLGALDRLAVLERATRRGGVLLRRAELARAA